MASRLELQRKFESLPGIKGVYFQPPESIRMEYDCILYVLDDIQGLYADDIRYRNYKRYQVTLISRDADCEIVEPILRGFSLISFNRYYSADNLHHWTFTLYF